MNQDRKKLEKFGPKTSVAYALLQSNATIHITKERRGDEVRSGPENMKRCQNEKLQRKKKNSVAGNRTRVSRVRAKYPNQLDYNGCVMKQVLNFIKPLINQPHNSSSC